MFQKILHRSSNMKTLFCSIPLFFALLFLGLFFFSLHVSGTEDRKNRLYEETCRELEHAYQNQVRDYLTENGLENCGITITHTTDDGKDRRYVLSLHHKGFDRLSPAAYEALLNTLQEMGQSRLNGPLRIEVW